MFVYERAVLKRGHLAAYAHATTFDTHLLIKEVISLSTSDLYFWDVITSSPDQF
jgi:hypothetical protein